MIDVDLEQAAYLYYIKLHPDYRHGGNRLIKQLTDGLLIALYHKGYRYLSGDFVAEEKESESKSFANNWQNHFQKNGSLVYASEDIVKYELMGKQRHIVINIESYLASQGAFPPTSV